MLLLVRYKFDNMDKQYNKVISCYSLKDAQYLIDTLIHEYESDMFSLKREELGDLTVIDSYFIEHENQVPDTWSQN